MPVGDANPWPARLLGYRFGGKVKGHVVPFGGVSMSVEEEFAKEIAKQLPVKEAYSDALKPAAKGLGQFGGDLIKAI